MERTAELDELWNDFHSVVNMNSRELRDWLAVEASGEDAEPYLPEDAGPLEGRQVLHILGKRKGDLTDADVTAMQQVIDTVRSRRGPELDAPITDDAERRRLMDLGHDPLRTL